MARRTTDLDGDDWRFGSVSPKPLEAPIDDRSQVHEWLPATVPGNVRSDLLALGRIEDPFYGTNNADSQWVDAFDWWYTRRLKVHLEEGERAFLICDGIDYISAVYLDEVELGRHEGMFSRQVYEVTGLTKAEGSQVAVRIWGSNSLPRRQLSWWDRLWSPIATPLQRGQEAFPPRSATLKCQMGFGWDFAPRIRTMGLWDGVSLVVTRSVFVRDVFIKTHLERGGARITVRAALHSDRAQKVDAEVLITRQSGSEASEGQWRYSLTLEQGQQTREVEFTLPEPHLWQPWDRGEPHVYDLQLRVLRQGQPLDSVQESFGVRSVEMARNPETPVGHEDWTVVLNGAPEFIRGANWVPLDALPGRVRPADYRALITMAKEAGINLLRVWGGGLREKRAFYALCDREGIMVWQDFPLACLLLGHFPRQRAFRNLLAQEGRSIVQQLRNHPSLILWCGGNEFSYQRNRRLADILETIVEQEDGTRPFRKSSPGRGDRHNWVVWHAKAAAHDYRKDRSQFVSEFGLQSLPHVSSLSRFLPQEELHPPGEGWRYHSAQLEKLERYVAPYHPQTIDEWVDASQKVQAYALQVAIEHFRRRKYRTSGTVFWQFNDPWPNISWSVVDYYGQPKLAYVKLEMLYNPVLVSLEYPSQEYGPGDLFQADIWTINDLLTPYRDCLLEICLDGRSIYSRTVSLPADSTQKVGSLQHRLGAHRGHLTVTLRTLSQLISSNEYDLLYHDPQNARWFDVLYSKLARWAME